MEKNRQKRNSKMRWEETENQDIGSKEAESKATGRRHRGKRVTALVLALAMAFCAGCGTRGAAITADTSLCQTNISEISVPDTVKIVGLGEASHGVSEYHQMKSEVFQALVANNGCRTFIIEGDFGGCLAVEDYIHGGEGTAKEALSQIGFGIYKTEELAELVDWMRSYNTTAEAGMDLHFYGMDMQRYDNNKKYLFEVLEKADAALYDQYQTAFVNLTDEARSNLEKDVLEQGKSNALNLLEELDKREADITAVVGEEAFAVARECANSIYESSELCASGTDYNTLRDGHMAEKVDWFVTHGDGSMLFINGHNGHISKTASAYCSLGAAIAEEYGDGYFCIGTDAADDGIKRESFRLAKMDFQFLHTKGGSTKSV